MRVDIHRFSLYSVWLSWRSLPIWVQVWVGLILVPVNAAAFFYTDTPTGRTAAIAAVFVVTTNVPIMLYEGGMSRLMAIPHLFVWFPLSIYIVGRLLTIWGGPPVEQTEFIFAVILLVINSISLGFDTFDTIRWFRGERDIPGHD